MKKMNLKFTQSNYFKSSIVNFFIINSGNLFTYLSIFLIGRNLSIKELSIFGFLMSITLYFSTPMNSISNTISKNFVNISSISLEKYYLKFTTFIILIYFIFSIILIFSIRNILGLSFNYVFLIILFLILNLYHSKISGYLQGRKKFLEFSFFASSPMYLRFAFLLLLVFLNKYNVQNVILCAIIPLFLIITFSYKKFIINVYQDYIINFSSIFLSKFRLVRISKNFFSGFVYLLIAFFLLNVLISLDVFIAKFLMDENSHSKYVALSMISKICFFLTTAFLVNFFPMMSMKKNDLKIQQILISLILTFIIGFLIIIFFKIFGNLIFSLTFNNKFVYDELELLKLTIGMMILSFVNIIFNFYAASLNIKFLILFFICIIFHTVILVVFTSSLNTFINLFLINNTILMIVLIIFSFFYLKLYRKFYNIF